MRAMRLFDSHDDAGGWLHPIRVGVIVVVLAAGAWTMAHRIGHGDQARVSRASGEDALEFSAIYDEDSGPLSELVDQAGDSIAGEARPTQKRAAAPRPSGAPRGDAAPGANPVTPPVATPAPTSTPNPTPTPTPTPTVEPVATPPAAATATETVQPAAVSPAPALQDVAGVVNTVAQQLEALTAAAPVSVQLQAQLDVPTLG